MYIWERPMQTMYYYIFKGQNMLGNIPYAYHEAETRVNYLNRENGNRYFYLFLVHCILYPIFYFKHVVLLFICYFQNKYEPGFELLIVWFVGSLFFFTVFVNQAYFRKEITVILSAWLRFEKFMKESGPVVEESAEKRRNKYLWFEFMFYCVGGFWVPILVGALYAFYPRLPCFLFSIVPKHWDDDPDWFYHRNFIKLIFGFFEVYIPVLGCTIIFATDILVSMIAKRISVSIDALTKANLLSSKAAVHNLWLGKPGTVSVYKAIKVLLEIFHSVYSPLICATETITLLLLVASIFAAMHPCTNPFIRFVLGSVGFLVATHTITYFLPMASILLKSQRFLYSMHFVEGNSLLAQKQMKSCPLVLVKPYGLHKITHIAVLEVFLLTIGLLQLLFELNIGL